MNAFTSFLVANSPWGRDVLNSEKQAERIKTLAIAKCQRKQELFNERGRLQKGLVKAREKKAQRSAQYKNGVAEFNAVVRSRVRLWHEGRTNVDDLIDDAIRSEKAAQYWPIFEAELEAQLVTPAIAALETFEREHKRELRKLRVRTRPRLSNSLPLR